MATERSIPTRRGVWLATTALAFVGVACVRWAPDRWPDHALELRATGYVLALGSLLGLVLHISRTAWRRGDAGTR